MSIRKIKRRTVAAMSSTLCLTLTLPKSFLWAMKSQGVRAVSAFVADAIRNHVRATTQKA